jgi:hypothetical protein
MVKMKKWFVDQVFVREGQVYDRGYYIREDGVIEWTEPIRNGETHEFPISECTHRDGNPIMIEDGELLGVLQSVHIQVQNSGFYGEGIDGTWAEMMVEVGTHVEGWNTYDVERTEWHYPYRHYWGTLDDENGKPIYNFYAIVSENDADIEIEKK